MGVVVQQGDEYRGVVDFLVDEMGFKRLSLPDRSSKVIRGKTELTLSILASTRELIRRRGRLSGEEDVVVFSMLSFPLKMLSRIRILQYRRLFCLGFFVHSPSWFPLFRQLVRFDCARDYYVLFARHEGKLYAQKLGIDPSRMLYLPYGDWSGYQQRVAPKPMRTLSEKPYFFAGGYSNRDYPALIEAFGKVDAELLIVCSALNKEVVDESLPANVRVLRDISSDDFDTYLRGARACIIPLKNDTGAAGQSVMLRLMRNRKIIIASDHGAVRDYVADGESGFLVKNIQAEVPELVARIEADPDLAKMGDAAFERYRLRFSREATSEVLRALLENPDSPQVAKCKSARGADFR